MRCRTRPLQSPQGWLARWTVGVEAGVAPQRLVVSMPTPNPSFGVIQIQFVSPRAGDGFVQIIDASGREVVALSRGSYAAGPHTMSWDGRDSGGRAVPAGLYWIRVSVGSELAHRSIVRVRWFGEEFPMVSHASFH